jgi:hypothetical protein
VVDPVRAMLHYDNIGYLPDDILVKVARARHMRIFPRKKKEENIWRTPLLYSLIGIGVALTTIELL